MRHTRYGYWLEEAGAVEPTPPLAGDTTADVVVVGGGYLGLWTAWQLKALEPGVRRRRARGRRSAGHGPSGRNGGFVSTLWDDLPILRDRVGDDTGGRGLPGVRARRARDRRLVRAQGVDAWYRAAPTLQVATSEAQAAPGTTVVDGAARRSARRTRCAS